MSTTIRSTSFRAASAVASLLMSFGAIAATASPAPSNAEIQARYEQERSVCLTGRSNQDQATCLKEAGAARQEALRGNLDVANEHYRRNALERCKVLPTEEARDCRLRIMGAGTTSGSVRDGGVLRELVTIEPAAPAQAASAP